MKTLLILGAGTGGTMVANKMSQLLDPHDWHIIVVDRDETHYYQPGFLFIPFGMYQPEDVMKPKRMFLPKNVEVVFSDIEIIEPEANRVRLALDGRVIHYDELVVATGSHIHPEETPGLLEGGWRQNIFDFYTLEGAVALGHLLERWPGGRFVLNVAEMPIKCPVAPLEFMFLADWYFRQRGIRDKVELVYATPLSGAFTKQRTSEVLGYLLEQKGIHVETDFNISAVDNTRQTISSFDEREIGYDLLVSIPTHMGADVIERSGMGNELGFVPTDKHTLQSKQWQNVWVIGDATDLPASKAGSVAHFELETLAPNIFRHSKGWALEPGFDGHANCFIESGFGKAFLIDFNYEVEPVTGTYPLPLVGPFSLLRESTVNHWGKLAFKWIYWNMLLKARPMPVPAHMSLIGKSLGAPAPTSAN
jgi:sulfide:quinone oxidoreductase